MDDFKAEKIESQSEVPMAEAARKGTTFLKTCFNGLNALSGVGILSIPYALSQGGWLSLIVLFLVAILCWYTGLLLRRCMDSSMRIKTYPDISELAFGYRGRAIVSIFLYLELYLVAVEFLILEGDNLHKLFPNMEFKIAGLKIGGKQGFVLLTSLVVLPSTWLKSLGIMAYFSAGGVLASIVLVVCVLWVGAVDGVVFPTLCNSMKDRSKFSKVLHVCFITSTIIYASMAVIGYRMYGEHLNAQVTLNLPVRKTSTKIAICTTLINPLTKYAIILTPLATAIEETTYLRNSRTLSILIRTALVGSTVVVALTIPFFGYIMAFIGASVDVTGSMLMPCLCYLKINKDSRSFGLE
ncbi:hypothetical protein SLEP1_g32218 [Rubroshorea leprosula]|uniref:Amino acid transporter transmembrane domain-containing protein n=1 Tax=Rubroshorea leprosula TaxID=152421 RepID=A0AAV5KCK0_9ROSI|nr:hypothetical protein SLEP1_g32218 [Rubroshorea leprosula]